jgi:REP element-mobilizing transposase RayT
MVIAYHCIFGMYGFWLPNDPRGSGSTYIASYELLRYGPATKTDSLVSVAKVKHDHVARLAAKTALQYPAVEITGKQAMCIAQGFRAASEEAIYRIYACAILPAHLHLVIGRTERNIRRVVGHLKTRGTQMLKANSLWFEDERPLWGRGGWNVFLTTKQAVHNSIAYVQANPVKEGLKPQTWSFVEPFCSNLN